MLSIENKMLKELEYKNLISQFTSQKVRKINYVKRTLIQKFN